ncbi:hypothetical protein [Cystobacter fuscus]|uniref:hypothetical protein n=1 Tax=Cystobacter fuscus TaxID=43 RepID=UPI001E4DDD72|nr:hypothetical protein [Cystobacter fuscus]
MPLTSGRGGGTSPEVAAPLMQALTSHNWGLLACGFVLGAVYVVRRFLSSRGPWLSSDVAGVPLPCPSL